MTDVSFQLRDHQRAINEGLQRWSCIVLHRRAGKSVFAVAKLMEQATANDRPGMRYHYIGPSAVQTRKIAMAYVEKFCESIPGVKINQSELKVTLPGGATIELCGTERVDSLRGQYSCGCILDEAQLMPLSHFTYVIRPLLADRQGWCIVTGTPSGKRNLLGWAHDQDDWFVKVLTVNDTTALDPVEIADMRKSMSAAAWDQEMMCSFTASLQGAIYGREMTELQQAGRLTTVKHDAMLNVTCACDLGHRDQFPTIFHQLAGTEHRIIGVRSYQFMSIPEIVNDWKSLPFKVDKVIVPHDAKVRGLTDGKTRQEVFEEMGYPTRLAPSMSLDAGIEQVRLALPHFWIDKTEAYEVFESLSSYRSELHELNGVFTPKPLHDIHSHIADAVRYLCIGDHSGANTSFAPRAKSNRGVYA